MDEKTGLLKLNTSAYFNPLDDTELVLYAIATVDLTPRRNSSVLNRLEYMCEIYIDLSSDSVSSTTAKISSQSPISANNEIRLLPSSVSLKLEETLEKDQIIFRFVSVLEAVDERRAFIKYELVETEDAKFEVDSKHGWLKLVRSLAVENKKLNLNVSACIETQCAYSKVDIEIIDINNNPPRYIYIYKLRCAILYY